MVTPPNVEQLFQAHPISAIAPEVALTLFAVLVLIAGAYAGDAALRRIAPALALVGIAVSGALLVPLWGARATFGPEATSIFVIDDFALFFKWVFLFGLAISVLLSGRFLNARGGDRHSVVGEYYGLMMLSTVGMMIVASAADLLGVFLGIETFSIALYVLAGFARTRLLSNEAALKYFLLGAFATGFLLYGIALTYFAVGSTNLAAIAGALSTTEGVRSMPLLLSGLALLLIGLGFKASLVPFHQWTPDVYDGSPSPVTAFMSTGAKVAAFAALLRVLPVSFGALSAQWQPLVIVIAVLTMTVGNVIAIVQTGLKRMLAYSSIAHAGYILIGVIAAAACARAGDLQGANQATAAVLNYTLIYAIMNLGAFAVLVAVEDHQARAGNLPSDGPADETVIISLDNLKGLAERRPLAAFAMAVFLLSLAGIPPTAGFFGKFIIFNAAINAHLLGLVLVGVLNSVVSVYYYLRPIVTMYSGAGAAASTTANPTGDIETGELQGSSAVLKSAPLSLSLKLAIVVCMVAVLGMIVLQGAVWPTAISAAQSITWVPGR